MVLDVAASEVFAQRKNAGSSWPKRGPDSRLGDSCEPFVSPKFDLKDCRSFFTIGSCFARNIEEYLIRRNTNVVSRDILFRPDEMFPNQRPNELLVKYTPSSILAELEYAIGGGPEFNVDDLPISDGKGKFFDPFIPTTYPSVTYERVIERRTEVRELFRKIKDVDAVVVTLGLIEDWYDAKLKMYLNSGPTPQMVKAEPDRYFFRILPFEENMKIVRRIIALIHTSNPRAKIILTTSPVPLGRTFTARDVLVANTYSKSTLRVISQDIADDLDFVDYFPSYEIVALSDKPNTWEDDQRHVLDSKVGKIMALFMEKYLGDVRQAGDPGDIYMDGKKSFESGNFEDALQKFLSVEPHFTHDLRFLSEICEAAVRINDHDTVLRVSAKIPESDPHFARVGLLQGQSLVSLRRLDEARDLLNKLVKIPNLEIRARRWLMEAAKASGNLNEEVSQAQQILRMIEEGNGSLPPPLVKRVTEASLKLSNQRVA